MKRNGSRKWDNKANFGKSIIMCLKRISRIWLNKLNTLEKNILLMFHFWKKRNKQTLKNKSQKNNKLKKSLWTKVKKK